MKVENRPSSQQWTNLILEKKMLYKYLAKELACNSNAMEPNLNEVAFAFLPMSIVFENLLN